MSPPDRRDPTLKGLGWRMDAVEDSVETLQVSLAKLVALTQRIQWTFTGLVIYYIIDHGDILKFLLKVAI